MTNKEFYNLKLNEIIINNDNQKLFKIITKFNNNKIKCINDKLYGVYLTGEHDVVYRNNLIKWSRI